MVGWHQYQGIEPVRREFLIKALRYYEEEAAEGNGAGAAARAEMANASFRVGRIHDMLSELDLAEPAFRRALSLLERLTKDFPNEPDHRLLLARSLNELGLLCWTEGQRTEAEDTFRRALQITEQSGTVFLDRPEFRQVMAKPLHNLAIPHHESGRLSEAETAYQRAIEIREKLLSESPADSTYRHDLAGGLGAFAQDFEHPRRCPQFGMMVFAAIGKNSPPEIGLNLFAALGNKPQILRT